MNKTAATYLALFLLHSSLIGCAAYKKPRIANFEKTSFAVLPGWNEDKHSIALKAFKNSCEKFLALDAEEEISKATQMGGAAIDWQVPCMQASSKSKHTDKEAKSFFEQWFQPYSVSNSDGKSGGTLTGYYQIELEGAHKKSKKFKFPVYRKPANIESLKGSSSFNQASINQGALHNKGLEIVYVNNRARLYFMHIQGSGVIKLQDGGELYLGFDGHNGYSFTGINQSFKDRNLKFNSAVGMMDWLHSNEEHGQEMIETDPSYVFFRKLDTLHPVGGQGVPLQPERSIAIDYGLYPYGAPIWVTSKLPHTKAYSARDYNRLFIAQDTGGAIRGAIRGDIFFGRGKKAEQVAGSFKSQGNFYVLFPKTITVPKSYEAK